MSRFPAFPVVTVIAAMAIFVTIAVKTGRTDSLPFMMSSLAFDDEPWRLASSALPHGDAFHLIFNVVWLWVLGTRLEETLGHVRTFAIMLLLAVGSAAAEFAFAAGGIGLSGVGYGLVGCLLVLANKDSRFRDAIDIRTLVLFGVWFVLCVVLTIADVWNVGNVAHGSGFVLGLFVGYAIAPGSRVRRVAAAGAVIAALAGALGAAALWRPHVNLSAYGFADDAYRGYLALGDQDFELAARHLERAVAINPKDAGSWFNYGLALQHVKGSLGMTTLEAWQRSLALDPTNAKTQAAVGHEQALQR